MSTKMKKIVIYTLISLSIATTGVYTYQKSVNTKNAQQKVVGRFVNTFYDNDYTEDFNNSLKELLSSDYSLEQIDFENLAVSLDNSEQTNVDYSGYSITKISKEKVNGKRATVYSVNVDFLNQDDIESPKRLYVELINEESEWKINKIMPRSVNIKCIQ